MKQLVQTATQRVNFTASSFHPNLILF
uniref:Uncharacterized protein n=1 Tax=Anguilla anguilla TaxID=7936 RepID=A0A0E9V4R9_ANGAN